MLFLCLAIMVLQRCVTAQPTTASVEELNKELEAEFRQMDIDKNNLITEYEMERYVLQQDIDRDGCISFTEFMRGRGHDSLTFSWALFNHFDHDHNGCLEHSDQVDEFHEIDVNPKDGTFTLQEFEEYDDKLYLKMGIPMSP